MYVRMDADPDSKNELQKLALNGQKIDDSQVRSLKIVHIVFLVLGLLSATAGFLTVGIWPEKTTLRLLVTTDYRDDATTLQGDFYPTITIDMSRTIDVGLVAAAVSLGMALSHLIGWVWLRMQAEQMMGGSNPFLWAGFILWHFITFLVVAPLAGVTNVFALTWIATLVVSWLIILWTIDLNNSFAIKYMLAKANVSGWSWLPVLLLFVPVIVAYVTLSIYAAETFGADAFAANGVSTGWYIAIVVVHLVLYLANPLIYVLWKANWITSIYTREMVFYIFNGIFAIASTWLTIGFLWADSVTLP